MFAARAADKPMEGITSANFSEQTDGLWRTSNQKTPLIAFDQRDKSPLPKGQDFSQAKLAMARARGAEQFLDDAPQPVPRW